MREEAKKQTRNRAFFLLELEKRIPPSRIDLLNSSILVSFHWITMHLVAHKRIGSY